MKGKKLLTLLGSVCLILVFAAMPFMSACAPEEVAPPPEGEKPAPPTIMEKEIEYEALNPCGFLPEIELTPLAPRVSDLSGKVVYIINSWREGSELEGVLAKAADSLGVKAVSLYKPSAYMSSDPELWDEMVEKADAFIYGAAPSCSTTMWAVTWAAGLEKRGLPGVVIIFDTLIEDAQMTCEKLGMPVRFVAVPYPPETITDKQMSEVMDRITQSLTAPLIEEEQKTGTMTPEKPPRVAVKGTLAEINDYFYKHHWTDGLPIVPPTEEKVAEMLKATSHAPDEVITTTMWPEEWTVTVEKVAINGVMAGCKPEYMPILLAAAEAFSSWDYASSVRSTNSFSFMMVVNGPIRKEVDMNSGIYALGPGNEANATIGRALRLFIINLGGGQSGVNIMGTQGNVSSYSFCFAENEEASPWESFAVEWGYKLDESTVTVFSGGWCHCGNYLGGSLDNLAKDAAVWEWPNGLVVLVAPPRARSLAEQGYSKQEVQQYIWEHATSTMKEFRSDIYYKMFIEAILKGKEMYGEKYLWPKEYLGLPDDAIVSVYPRKYVYVIVVGGETNAMMQGWKMAYPSTASIDKWR